MSKLTLVPARKSLGFYFDRIRKRIPAEAAFYIGVLLTLVLPAAVCVAYAGTISFVAFTATALVGSAWGLTMYRQSSYRIASSMGTRDVPQTPTRRDAPLKKAA